VDTVWRSFDAADVAFTNFNVLISIWTTESANGVTKCSPSDNGWTVRSTAPNSVNTLYQSVGLDYENRIITPTVEEVVKQVTANYNAEELITKRPLVKSDIEAEINTRLSQFDIITEIVSITDFQFSALFAQAIESKVEAEQKAFKAENDLKRIEVEARQHAAQAEGIAAANIAEANGEAAAIRIINEALSTNPNYLEWLKTQQWDGKLPLVVGEGGTPFIAIPTR